MSCVVLCRYVTPVQLICWGRRISFVLFFVGVCLCGSGSIPESSARTGAPRYLSLCCSKVFKSTGVGGPAGIALLSRARPITQICTDEAQKAEKVRYSSLP